MGMTYYKKYSYHLATMTLALAPLLWVRCGDTFMKQKVTNETSGAFELAATADAAGNFTGTIDPTSTTTQVLRASSGELSGSAIALPPGVLSINLNITIGAGESLASGDTTQQLGLGSNSASAAGPAVSFVPSQNIQASSPFTLSIPVSGTSLALASSDNENMIVMYKWMKVENGVTSYAIGIITRDQLTVGSKAVQFQTDKFGTFQLAVTQTKITEPISKPTAEPPMLKADVSNPLVGVWSKCNNYDSWSTGPSPSPFPSTAPTPSPSVEPTLTASFSGNLTAYVAVTAVSPASSGMPYQAVIYYDGSSTAPFSFTNADNNSSYTIYKSGTFSMNKVAYVLLSPNCYFGAPNGDPRVQRRYFSDSQTLGALSPSTDQIQVTCDENGFQAMLAASSTGNTASPNYSDDGDSRDHLGIPKASTKVSSREYVKFSSSTFVHSRSIFSDANCAGTLISRIEEAGTYKVGAPNSDGIMPMSITFATNTGTIFSAAAVIWANSNPLVSGCGFSDWVINQSKNLATSPRCSESRSDGRDSGPSAVKIKDNNIYFDDGGNGVINTKDFMTRSQ